MDFETIKKSRLNKEKDKEFLKLIEIYETDELNSSEKEKKLKIIMESN